MPLARNAGGRPVGRRGPSGAGKRRRSTRRQLDRGPDAISCQEGGAYGWARMAPPQP